ncbi:hypothetical protein GALMADRAFT_237652 [Galerina marginata CBS 339.88]|uniref:Yeast cell wall synthesis Kre9/Knh1-like N-terminal domain-containing protein n=1 Tax=Galerina marginata (strain CBS 339.88) TaxID=685588 RepID=A0A067TR39_GALM3|nr:hypothetical protein GALMADRAFT_237652 [Galerina marginata CBS 339.88]
MFALQALLTTAIAYLALRVHASPLSNRDVIVPHITSPDASSVWPVGTAQTVTWDTSNFPPDSQITNPIGQVILGTNASGTFHFNFNDPLAKGFKLRDGSVKITVPDVTPGDDYLIVLFGDSGNTSPTFAITKISSGTPSGSPVGVGSSSSSTLITTPIPITGSVITGPVTTEASTVASVTPTDSNTSSPTPTSPSGSSSSTGSSSSSSPPPTQAPSTSAAWSVRQASGSILNVNALMVCMASMIMLVMV